LCITAEQCLPLVFECGNPLSTHQAQQFSLWAPRLDAQHADYLNREQGGRIFKVWGISNWNFEFVSDFEFRISDFQVNAALLTEFAPDKRLDRR
jgi:hypothetical protein